MSSRDLIMSSAGSGQLYVDDVFSTYTYSGTSSPQTINNGIDLRPVSSSFSSTPVFKVFDSISPTGMCRDSVGNIILVGYSRNGSTPWTARIIKLDSIGNILWQKQVNLDGSNGGDFTSVSTDSSNNIYAIGTQYISLQPDMVLVKYNSSGTLVWERDINSGTNDYPCGVFIDSLNNLYISGGNYNQYAFIAKVDTSNGTFIWQKIISSGYATRIKQMTVSSITNNVFFVGDCGDATSPSTRDQFIGCITSAGSLLWKRAIGKDHISNNDWGNCITLDGSDNVYVGGSIEGSPSGGSLVKYNSSGTFQFSKVLVNTTSIVGVIFNSLDSNLWVTSSNGCILKVDTSGGIQAQYKVSGDNYGISSQPFINNNQLFFAGGSGGLANYGYLSSIPLDGYGMNGISMFGSITYTTTTNVTSNDVVLVDRVGPGSISDSTWSNTELTIIDSSSNITIIQANNVVSGGGYGGLVWIKQRTLNQSPANHLLFDTVRGTSQSLSSNNTSVPQTGLTDEIISFNSTGFSLGSDAAHLESNRSGENYVSWTFRKAPKFFDIVTYTGDGTSSRQISHNLNIEPGMIIYKCTNTTSDWAVYHKDAISNLYLNKTDSQNATPSIRITAVATNSNNLSVAVGYGILDNYAYYSISTNGETWSIPSIMNTAVDANMKAIAVNSSGRFIAVGASSTGTPMYATSINGTTWTTPSSSGVVYPFTSIAVNSSGLFVALGVATLTGDSIVYTTTNGSSWSSLVLPVSKCTKSIAVNSSGTFVIVGSDSSNNNSFISQTSTDGVTWTSVVTKQGPVNIFAVTSNAAGKFIAVGRETTNGYPGYITSTNGTSWSNFTVFNNATTTGYMTDVIAYSTTFVAVGYNSNNYPIYSLSTDSGVTWSTPATISSSFLANLFGLTVTSEGKFIAVGSHEGSGESYSISVSSLTGSSWGSIHQMKGIYNSSTFEIPSTVNVSENTYIAYLFAHDTDPNGLIQCGSFTTDGSGNATVNLGWEPQYLMAKVSSSSGHEWKIVDSIRGMPVQGSNDAPLSANSSGAELSGAATFFPTAVGFKVSHAASMTNIYIAIRRPNKPPTSGTQVYNALTYIGDGTVKRKLTGVGFSPDMVIHKYQGGTGYYATNSKLLGASGASGVNDTLALNTNGKATDRSITGFTMDGVITPTDPAYWEYNNSGQDSILWSFKRAIGFFDVVCYTGTGASPMTVNHNLGVVPELIITKERNNDYAQSINWEVWHNTFPTTSGNAKSIRLNSSDAAYISDNYYGLNTSINNYSLQGGFFLSENGVQFVAYLFATLAGISKVGSYTGNGTTQTINCGFSAGVRFVMIKRTDSTGDWYVWDTARGIVEANESRLSLNSPAAQNASYDSIDQNSTGFIVNQITDTNINVTSATYIYLAIA